LPRRRRTLAWRRGGGARQRVQQDGIKLAEEVSA
jgi:hypothetical protein